MQEGKQKKIIDEMGGKEKLEAPVQETNNLILIDLT